MVLLMFFQAVYFGHPLSFYTMQLEPPKVYDVAPLNDRLGELIRAVIFGLINHGCFAKLGPVQGFNFFSSIH